MRGSKPLTPKKTYPVPYSELSDHEARIRRKTINVAFNRRVELQPERMIVGLYKELSENYNATREEVQSIVHMTQGQKLENHGI